MHLVMRNSAPRIVKEMKRLNIEFTVCFVDFRTTLDSVSRSERLLLFISFLSMAFQNQSSKQ